MLDRFYIPKQCRLGIHHKTYYIHGYTLDSDYSPIQMEINIGNSEVRTSAFKWNVSHLQGKILNQLSKTWAGLPAQTSFFSKLKVISRLYREVSKSKAREVRRLELDTKAKLGIATAKLHKDPYNISRQGKVSHLQDKIDDIKTHRARGAAIRARIKWQKVGDKCTAEFFKSVRQKNS